MLQVAVTSTTLSEKCCFIFLSPILFGHVVILCLQAAVNDNAHQPLIAFQLSCISLFVNYQLLVTNSKTKLAFIIHPGSIGSKTTWCNVHASNYKPNMCDCVLTKATYP